LISFCFSTPEHENRVWDISYYTERQEQRRLSRSKRVQRVQVTRCEVIVVARERWKSFTENIVPFNKKKKHKSNQTRLVHVIRIISLRV
jgi:hypothetical protein